MHLMEYAQINELPLDYNKYLDMFITTAKRLIICYFE